VNNRGFIDFMEGREMIWLGVLLVVSLLVAVLCAVKLAGKVDNESGYK